MAQPIFTLSEQSLRNIIRHSYQNLRGDSDVIKTFEKLADLASKNDSNIEAEEESVIDDTIPDELQPLAKALFGVTDSIDSDA